MDFYYGKERAISERSQKYVERFSRDSVIAPRVTLSGRSPSLIRIVHAVFESRRPEVGRKLNAWDFTMGDLETPSVLENRSIDFRETR